MSLRKARICGLWALGALAIGFQGARAQEPTTPGAPAAKPAAAAASDHAAAQGVPQPVSTAAPQANPSGPPTVCFKFTMRCFGNNLAAADSAHASSAKASSHAARNADGSSQPAQSGSLNLTPPDVRTVIPLKELQEPLPTEDQQEQQTDTATVEVRTDPDTPNVPGGFGALFWALRHPTQAWRIFTPVE